MIRVLENILIVSYGIIMLWFVWFVIKQEIRLFRISRREKKFNDMKHR